MSIESIKNHIKKVYLTYQRPMIIGFSGGKDSSATLQIFWDAISEIPKEELVNKIYVITTDTMVETPYVLAHISITIDGINKKAVENDLPIEALKLHPEIEKTFWVNLLGKGYPAPTQMFRWCTDRLKIEPVNKFISNLTDEAGEAIVVLGARKSESISRNQVMSKKIRDKFGLSKHPTLSSAYVFTPIEEMSTNEVWDYLLSNPITPWGGSNRDLSAMYMNASDKECPTVIDKSTSSCGQSRFGCWVCTLVKKDTSMENLIDNGEDWMIPMLEFRNLLNETTDPKLKSKYRNLKGRDGKIRETRDGQKLARRTLKPAWKMEFLKRLLLVQKSIRKNGPDPNTELITLDELNIIRRIWINEDSDWKDSLPKLYKDVFGEEFPGIRNDSSYFNTDDLSHLENVCKQENVAIELVSKLIDLENQMSGLTKRSGIIQKIDKLFNQDWRSEEELLKLHSEKNDN